MSDRALAAASVAVPFALTAAVAAALFDDAAGWIGAAAMVAGGAVGGLALGGPVAAGLRARSLPRRAAGGWLAAAAAGYVAGVGLALVAVAAVDGLPDGVALDPVSAASAFAYSLVIGSPFLVAAAVVGGGLGLALQARWSR